MLLTSNLQIDIFDV
jgi:hypothetical protein